MSQPDPVSLNDLLAHREWVRGFAAALARDPADADDLAQDAWASALRSPPGAGTSVRAWFATVMRNRVRDRARHGRIVTDRMREAARDATAGTSPAELAERAETERRVLSLVLDLDEPFRDTVLLRFWRGMEPAEIAELRGVPAATVRTRLHRGLAEVRRKLDRDDAGGRWRAVLLPGGIGSGRAGGIGPGGAVVAVKSKAIVAVVLVLACLGVAAAVMLRGDGGGAAPPAEVATGDPAGPRSPGPGSRTPEAARTTGRAAPPSPEATTGTAPVNPAAADAPPAKPIPTVAVVVTGPDGRPVPDADVFALPASNSKDPTVEEFAGRASVVAAAATRSGADGAATLAWSFEPGPGRVLARAGDLCGVSNSVGMPSAEPVTVRLETTFVVAGRVEDDEGRPVARARLALEADLGGGMEPFSAATSGDDGAFRFARLPKSFEGSAATVAASAKGFAPEWVMLKEEGRDPNALVIVLHRAMVLTGRVVDDAGRPVGDVTVEISTGDNVFTAADGRFRSQPLRPKDARVGILSDDHAAVAIQVKDAVPGERDLGDVVVRAGKAIRGRVLRPDGSAAKGAWVGVEDPEVGQFVRQGMTDAEGRFEFLHLGAGPLEVSASDSSDGAFAGSRAVAKDARAGGDDLVLTLSAGRSVLVRVVDATTGEPVKADFIVVNVRPAGADPTNDGSTTLFDTRDGRVTVRVPTETTGAHLVKVRVRGFAEYGPERIEVDDDGRAVVTAKLVREGK